MGLAQLFDPLGIPFGKSCFRASGHPAAVLPTSVMNSRRLTGPLKQRALPYHAVGRIVHHGKF